MDKIKEKADIGRIVPKETRFEMLDSVVAGLRLRVWPTGAKKWSLLYRTPAGAFSRLSLGDFGESPDLTLAAARKAAQAKKVAIAAGQDPQEEKRQKRAVARAERAAKLDAKGETVEAVALQCVEALKLRPATRREWLRLIHVEIAPTFPGRAAKELTRPEIKAWTRKLARRNGWIANRSFSLLRRVYSWAASDDIELVGASPLVGMKKPFEDETESERVLSAADLRAILRALNALDLRGEFEREEKESEGPGIPYVEACRLLLLTGVRRSAVIGAKRAEFEGLDGKTPQWVVPGGAYGRSKSGRPHVVPLSPAALEVVRRRMAVAKGSFLFPVRRLVKGKTEKDRPMTWDSHFMGLLKDTADKIVGASMEPWKLHGFRAALATNSREHLKVSGDVVGALLGHKKPGAAVTRVYDRSELLEEKRDALCLWADWLEDLERNDGETWTRNAGRSNVVSMASRRVS